MTESPMMEEQRTHYDAIHWLWRAGLRFGSVIDGGCADGQLTVVLAELGPLRDCTILNIDAQEDYRDSLASIQAVLGGHFRICALGERDGGTIALQRGAHSYWASTRPADDRYWATLNDLREETAVQVPLRTLDALVEETRLPGPFLLKLDVQGAEKSTLLGATRTLANTDVVAVEVMLEDFPDIQRVLADNGFELFDITDMSYTHAGVLGWFYAVYLNLRHRRLRPTQYWAPDSNENAIAMQHQRRDSIRSLIDDALARRRAGAWPALPG